MIFILSSFCVFFAPVTIARLRDLARLRERVLDLEFVGVSGSCVVSVGGSFSVSWELVLVGSWCDLRLALSRG